MSIAVPRGYRTDRTDLLLLAEQILTAARTRRLELEAAEIAERICARLDGVPKHDLPEGADVTVSPLRTACVEYLHDQQEMSPSYALEDPQRFTVQAIEDGSGLALFGVWTGDKYHEAMMSVPGVEDVRFNNATNFWPEGVPEAEQQSRQDYWVGLLGNDRGTPIVLEMPNDPGLNLSEHLPLVVDHQPAAGERAVNLLERVIAQEAVRRLRADGSFDAGRVMSLFNAFRRAAWNHLDAVTGIEPLTVGVAGGIDPAPPAPAVDQDAVSAAVEESLDELHARR